MQPSSLSALPTSTDRGHTHRTSTSDPTRRSAGPAPETGGPSYGDPSNSGPRDVTDTVELRSTGPRRPEAPTSRPPSDVATAHLSTRRSAGDSGDRPEPTLASSTGPVRPEKAPTSPSDVAPQAPVSFGPSQVAPQAPVSVGPSQVAPQAPVSFGPSQVAPQAPVSFGPSQVAPQAPVSFGPSEVAPQAPVSVTPSSAIPDLEDLEKDVQRDLGNLLEHVKRSFNRSAEPRGFSAYAPFLGDPSPIGKEIDHAG